MVLAGREEKPNRKFSVPPGHVRNQVWSPSLVHCLAHSKRRQALKTWKVLTVLGLVGLPLAAMAQSTSAPLATGGQTDRNASSAGIAGYTAPGMTSTPAPVPRAGAGAEGSGSGDGSGG